MGLLLESLLREKIYASLPNSAHGAGFTEFLGRHSTSDGANADLQMVKRTREWPTPEKEIET